LVIPQMKVRPLEGAHSARAAPTCANIATAAATRMYILLKAMTVLSAQLSSQIRAGDLTRALRRLPG
jgi:hypothetical protein